MTYHVEKAPGSLHSLLWNLLTGYFDGVLTQGWLLAGCFDRGLRLTKRSDWRKDEYRSRSWWFNLNFSGLMHRIFSINYFLHSAKNSFQSLCKTVTNFSFDRLIGGTLSPSPPLILVPCSCVGLWKFLVWGLAWKDIENVNWHRDHLRFSPLASDKISWMLFSLSCLTLTFNFTKTNLINDKKRSSDRQIWRFSSKTDFKEGFKSLPNCFLEDFQQ